jgi:hypothetical protein
MRPTSVLQHLSRQREIEMDRLRIFVESRTSMPAQLWSSETVHEITRNDQVVLFVLLRGAYWFSAALLKASELGGILNWW